jgi:hypothetical protein
MSDYVACLDTSMILDIFDECLKAGQEPERWIEFKSLIDTKQALLVVPEIVLLEFDKGIRERIDCRLAAGVCHDMVVLSSWLRTK